MADTTYVDGQQPLIYAAWLNDINNVAYRVLGSGGAVPTTVAQLLANLGLTGTITVGGNNSFTGTNSFAGPTTFTGAVTFNDTVTHEGTETFQGTSTFTGAVNLPNSVDVGSAVLSALGYQYADTATQPQAFSLQTPTLASGSMTLTSNPCNLSFRNASLTTGGLVTLALASAVGITIPSGATLGALAGQTIRIAHGFAYNGGSPVPIVGNINGLNTDTSTLISPTMISSSSNAAGTWYSKSAVSANSPFVIIGFYDSTQATAGTYATAPNVVPGDVAHIGSMQSLGYGQTLQDLHASRAANIIYYNTTSRPIFIEITVNLAAGGYAYLFKTVGTSNTQIQAWYVSGASSTDVVISSIILPDQGYEIASGGGGFSLAGWYETR